MTDKPVWCLILRWNVGELPSSRNFSFEMKLKVSARWFLQLSSSRQRHYLSLKLIIITLFVRNTFLYLHQLNKEKVKSLNSKNKKQRRKNWNFWKVTSMKISKLKTRGSQVRNVFLYSFLKYYKKHTLNKVWIFIDCSFSKLFCLLHRFTKFFESTGHRQYSKTNQTTPNSWESLL